MSLSRSEDMHVVKQYGKSLFVSFFQLINFAIFGISYALSDYFVSATPPTILYQSL